MTIQPTYGSLESKTKHKWLIEMLGALEKECDPLRIREIRTVVCFCLDEAERRLNKTEYK